MPKLKLKLELWAWAEAYNLQLGSQSFGTWSSGTSLWSSRSFGFTLELQKFRFHFGAPEVSAPFWSSKNFGFSLDLRSFGFSLELQKFRLQFGAQKLRLELENFELKNTQLKIKISMMFFIFFSARLPSVPFLKSKRKVFINKESKFNSVYIF